jgi:glycosyltransferase involved in cell wall biosynthesis
VISGALETSLHPVPPVMDGAPEWNVFRLAEVASELEIHVVSPCEAGQLPALRSFPAKGQYHHVVFSQPQLWLYRRLLRHVFPLRLAVRRLAKLPDLMSWWYLRRAVLLQDRLQPDVVIINGRPQYIRYLRKQVPKGCLLMFMRATMGESRRFLHLLDGIIVNSEGMAAYARQFVDPASTPIWSMPNTLGNEFAGPTLPPDRFTRPDKQVVFAGRIIPEKGVLELLEAFRLVHERAPGTTLVLCGASANFKRNGSLTPYERAVKQRAATLPQGAVRWVGYVPNAEMPKYYGGAALAVFPSICLESFGMVALEAMRCGTPVVASRRPGFEELIRHEDTGLLVDDPSDASCLAQTMLRILKDADLAERMGKVAHRRSLDFSPIAAARRLEAIVGSALEALGRMT